MNLRAREHPIGALQEIRTKLKRLSRRPQKDIFSPQTTFDNWAFHHGGRSELQFNIGLEDDSNFRHGVAFSFQRTQTLSSIAILIPKVRLFNEFMRLYSDRYEDMRMWHWEGERSPDYMPTPIPAERVTEGVFVFLGKRRPVDQIDCELVLDDFDKLLPLYRYVEGGGESQPVLMPSATKFVFRSGCSAKASSAIATQAEKQLDMNLRHNELQLTLFLQLASQYGKENVGTEIPSAVGTSIDLVVRRKGGYWFYEIKTASSPRACLREAVGQLLEYAFWPGAQGATRLIVVGEAALDKDGKEYLHRLNEGFSLPIGYEQLVV